jgi:hypothetical protein
MPKTSPTSLPGSKRRLSEWWAAWPSGLTVAVDCSAAFAVPTSSWLSIFIGFAPGARPPGAATQYRSPRTGKTRGTARRARRARALDDGRNTSRAMSGRGGDSAVGAGRSHDSTPSLVGFSVQRTTLRPRSVAGQQDPSDSLRAAPDRVRHVSRRRLHRVPFLSAPQRTQRT